MTLLSSPCNIHLVSKANQENYIDIRTGNIKDFIENGVVLAKPPVLTVVCGEASIEALKGGYSWETVNEDDTATTVIADSAHPLDCKEMMPSIRLMPGYLSHVNPFAAYLQWSVHPDNVSVRCWSEECWGQYDAESEDLPVKTLEIDFVGGGYGTNFIIDLKDGTYIYEVTAQWDRTEHYNGTAYYSFYTVKPDMELQVTEERNDLCSYPLAPTE